MDIDKVLRSEVEVGGGVVKTWMEPKHEEVFLLFCIWGSQKARESHAGSYAHLIIVMTIHKSS